MQKNEIEDKEISWTEEELDKWAEAGLLPRKLLSPLRFHELGCFIFENKETLYKCYRSQPDENLITIPPIGSFNDADEVRVIDKRTGLTVKILERSEPFELCEGISLQVKSKELADWKKEAADAKTLSKEQHETLKSAIEKIDKELTRKEIVLLLEEIRKPQKKTKKYRQGGHIVDQKLKYQLPQEQPSLFDQLSEETKARIEEYTQEHRIEVKAEGIRLTHAEDKVINALYKILHEKSQNTDPKSSNFYSGNEPSDLIPYGQDQQAKSVRIKFRPTELYKAFMGSADYSGADVKYIVNTLHQLEQKKVLIKYDRVTKTKSVEKTDRIEEFSSLIKIVSFIPDLSNEEKEALDKGDNSIREAKGEIIILLNPIFTDQIDKKFIEYPEDTNRRLVIAAGGHKKVTASMSRLMDYLLRDISAKRYRSEINEDKLPYMLGLEKYIEQRQKKKLQERIEKDIQANINLGIILSVEKRPNTTGGLKWVFHLNKDYD
jgi:hypothetical protein